MIATDKYQKDGFGGKSSIDNCRRKIVISIYAHGTSSHFHAW